MKLIVSLILFVLTTLFVTVYSVPSLLSIKNFNYDIIKCSKSGSSHDGGSSNGGSFGGFGDDRLQLGSVDGGGTPPSGASSEESLCDNLELISQVYVKFDTCAKINDFYYLFSMNYENGQITRKLYSTFENCSSSVHPDSTINVQVFTCVDDCTTNPYMYEIIDFDDIQISSNTLVSVDFPYSDNCQGNWKQTFYSIQVTPTNKCLTTGENESTYITCNSTNSKVYSSDRYNCNEFFSSEVKNLGGSCGQSTDSVFEYCTA